MKEWLFWVAVTLGLLYLMVVIAAVALDKYKEITWAY